MDQEWATQVVETVRRAAAGDQEAWDAIVKEYNGLLWSVVRGFRLGEQQTADVVQTTWLRLIENLGSIQDPRRLPGWLAVTARNLSIEAIRHARRLRPLDEDYELASNDELPDALVLRDERVTLVRAALRRLSDRDQQLLTSLAASPPVPYDEISKQLGMPVGSIGPTRMRALQRLRAELVACGLVDATS